MPAMSTIAVKRDDGTDVTFQPISDSPHLWQTRFSGLPLDGQTALEVKTEQMKGGKLRVNIKLSQPLMEVIPAGSVNASGVQAAPAVADSDVASLTFYLSPRGSNETRADLVRMLAHILSGAGTGSGATLAPQSSVADSFRDATSASLLPYGLINLIWPQ